MGSCNSGGKGGGGGTALGRGKVPQSISECTNFDELERYLTSRNITMSGTLRDLKFEETRNAMDGALFVLDEFGATSQLKGFGTKDSGVMCATFGGDINFNKSYFREGTRDLSAVMNGSSFHPKNQNAYTTGAHEAGHILEAFIARKQSGDDWGARRLAWTNETVAKDIINKCGTNVKKQYRSRGEKAPSLNFLVHSVSGYASKSRSEAFAECINDYVANGKNANALSIEVWNYTKNLMKTL